jgi:SAM-dependent methyltransferase
MIARPPFTMRGVSVELRRAFMGLRTEGAGAGRETAAVALGVFIGCLPVYGFHLLLCWLAGVLLGLNRLKMYLAANISNPLVAPWLIFAEVQAGAWLRRGSFHQLSRQSIASTALTVFGVDALVGSLLVGVVLSVVAAAGTYSLVRGSGQDRPFVDLVRRAADRYLDASITAWEFARGKLRMDPVYRATLSSDVLPSGGTLVDLGCGQGLTLALLAEARLAFDARAWPPAWPPPPRFERVVGIETRRRVAAIARRALDGDAEVIEGDARVVALDRARAVLLFDVLHLLTPDDQDSLIAAVAGRLEPGGVVLVREADAGAGWRFTAVHAGNRLKALVTGTWRRQSFHPRTEHEWRDCFSRHGFLVDARPMGEGTPFANVLFRLTLRGSCNSKLLS